MFFLLASARGELLQNPTRFRQETVWFHSRKASVQHFSWGQRRTSLLTRKNLSRLSETYAPIKSKLQHASARANPGHLTIFCARGVGNLTEKPSRGGEFDLCLGGVRKIEPEVSVFKWFFFFWGGGGVPKPLTAIKHVWGRDEGV